MSTFKDAYGIREFNLNSAAGGMNWMIEGLEGLESMTDEDIAATVDLHISNAKDEYFNEFEEDAPEDELEAARAAAIEFIAGERDDLMEGNEN